MLQRGKASGIRCCWAEAENGLGLGVFSCFLQVSLNILPFLQSGFAYLRQLG